MKRTILIISIFAVIISCFCFSVGATSSKEFLDYNDFLESVTVVGEEDLVTWSFPLSFYSCDTYNITTKQYQTIKQSNSMTASFVAGNQYRVSFYSPYLAIDNIPSNTSISAQFELDLTRVLGDNKALLNVGASYFDENGNFIKQVNGSMREVGLETGLYTDMIVSRDIAGAVGVQIFYQFNYYVVDYSGTATISLVDSEFSCAISSLYRENALNNKQNKLLSAIEDQLEQNGAKLDQIIDGSVDSVAPDGADKVGDLSGLEDNLMNDSQQGFDEADYIFNNAPGFVALYSSGFLFMSAVIEHIYSAGWLSGILTVSLSLGLFAFIANIASNVFKSSITSKGKGGKT